MDSTLNKIRDQLARIPLLGWLFGVLIAVGAEYLGGFPLAQALGLAGIPALFGFEIILKQPLLFPSTVLYVLLVYLLPAAIVAWLSASLANRLAAWLLRFPLLLSVAIHLGLLCTCGPV